MYLKRFWTGLVLGIVIVLTFASIFIAKADWGKQGKEKCFKVQHYDYASSKSLDIHKLLVIIVLALHLRNRYDMRQQSLSRWTTFFLHQNLKNIQ